MRLLAIQICLLLTICALAQAEFRDNFDGELNPLWEHVMGEWEIQDGNYSVKTAGMLPGFSLLPFEVADGMEIEVRGMDTDTGRWNNALIVISYVDETEAYMVGPAIIRKEWWMICVPHAGWQDPRAILLGAVDAPVR